MSVDVRERPPHGRHLDHGDLITFHRLAEPPEAPMTWPSRQNTASSPQAGIFPAGQKSAPGAFYVYLDLPPPPQPCREHARENQTLHRTRR